MTSPNNGDGTSTREGLRPATLETIPPAPPGSTKPLVHARRLSKYFVRQRPSGGEPEIVRAVDGVSLYVRIGETFGLIGESGSGKTTLLHTLLALTEADYGSVEFDGLDVLALPARQLRKLRRRFQIVVQAPTAALPSEQTALWAVEQGLEAHGIAPTQSEREKLGMQWLERVGLRSHLTPSPFGELSSGDRQRVLLARSLALEPDFVALDEPMGALDPASRTHILNLLVEVQQARQTALLLVSRDIAVIGRISQRVAVMYAGGLVETGPTTSVLARPRHPYTQSLLAAAPNSRTHRLQVLPILTEAALTRPRVGCPFQPRCPKAGQGCDTLMPGWVEVGLDHHRVACWFPDG